MFDKLDSALQNLDQVLQRLDPESLDPAAAADLFEKFARVERLGAAGKALMGRRFANSGEWMNKLVRSPAHWMASVAGTSIGRAVSVLQTAELLKELPCAEAAYRRGELSEPQVEELASAAALSPDSQEYLLAVAEGEALTEFKRECARVRAAARSEKLRHDHLHRHRQLRHWTDIEGAFRLDGRFTPEAGALLWTALEPFKVKASMRTPGKESDGAYAADALVAMARQSLNSADDALRSGPGAVVHVRVDYGALMRGELSPGEVCEVPGVGPIPVAAARAFASDSFLCAVLMDGQDVRAVSHLGRTIPDRLKTALIERDQTCVVPGCSEHEDLEIDHIIPVHHRGPTSLRNLARLCHWHHYQKTYFGHTLERTAGKWIWHGPNGPPPDPLALQPELVSAG